MSLHMQNLPAEVAEAALTETLSLAKKTWETTISEPELELASLGRIFDQLQRKNLEMSEILIENWLAWSSKRDPPGYTQSPVKQRGLLQRLFDLASLYREEKQHKGTKQLHLIAVAVANNFFGKNSPEFYDACACFFLSSNQAESAMTVYLHTCAHYSCFLEKLVKFAILLAQSEPEEACRTMLSGKIDCTVENLQAAVHYHESHENEEIVQKLKVFELKPSMDTSATLSIEERISFDPVTAKESYDNFHGFTEQIGETTVKLIIQAVERSNFSHSTKLSLLEWALTFPVTSESFQLKPLLALAYAETGKDRIANELLKEAFEAALEILEDNPEASYIGVVEVAECYECWNEPLKTYSLYERYMTQCEAKLGYGHPVTNEVQGAFGILLVDQDECERAANVYREAKKSLSSEVAEQAEKNLKALNSWMGWE